MLQSMLTDNQYLKKKFCLEKIFVIINKIQKSLQHFKQESYEIRHKRTVTYRLWHNNDSAQFCIRISSMFSGMQSIS